MFKASARYFVCVALVALLVFAVGCAPKPRYPDIQVGNRIPDFELSSLDGELVSSATFQGTPVVLNFWATWCSPCVKEIPTLTTLDERSQAQVVTIALDVEGESIVRPFVEKHSIDYTVLLGNQEVFQRYNGYAIPYTLVLDDTLEIVSMHRGYVSLRSLERDLRRAAS